MDEVCSQLSIPVQRSLIALSDKNILQCKSNISDYHFLHANIDKLAFIYGCNIRLVPVDNRTYLSDSDVAFQLIRTQNEPMNQQVKFSLLPALQLLIKYRLNQDKIDHRVLSKRFNKGDSIVIQAYKSFHKKNEYKSILQTKPQKILDKYLNNYRKYSKISVRVFESLTGNKRVLFDHKISILSTCKQLKAELKLLSGNITNTDKLFMHQNGQLKLLSLDSEESLLLSGISPPGINLIMNIK